MTDILHEGSFRLTDADCDTTGIVYLASYYPWMERVYSEWLYLQDAAGSRMQQRWGVSSLTRVSSCEYLKPTFPFDRLSCRVWLQAIGRTSYTMGFDIVRTETNELVASGRMTFVIINNDLQPIPIPEPMINILQNPSGVYSPTVAD